MTIAFIDFETYSEAGFDIETTATKKGLSLVGAPVYSEHLSTKVLCLAYNFNHNNIICLWTPNDKLPPIDLFAHIKNGGLIEAWNVSFEKWIWQNVCVKKYGWIELPLNQLRDSMAKSRAYSLPGALKSAGVALNITDKKDKRGEELIKLLCVPNKKYTENQQFLNHLYEYCKQDIKAEKEIVSLIPDLSPDELQFWQCDLAINHRGIQIDLETVNASIKIIEQLYTRENEKLKNLTKGKITSAFEALRIAKYCDIKNCTEEVIDSTLKNEKIPQKIRDILTIRKQCALSSVKKLYALKYRVTKNQRIHDSFIYHGAHTGRATGSGVQPQNLPRADYKINFCYQCNQYSKKDFNYCPHCHIKNTIKPVDFDINAIEYVINFLRVGDLNYLELFFNDVTLLISSCIRSLFIAKPGYDLICSDFSAIEAVVLAVLANEEWRLEIFKTHGKIYEASAAKITGVSLETILNYKKENKSHHPHRVLGKVAELASGYQGGLVAWKRAKADKYFNTEEQIFTAIKTWRKENYNIVRFWYDVEKSFKYVINNKNYRLRLRELTFYNENNNVFIVLPSGRKLIYHKAKIEFDKIIFQSNKNLWAETYGGKIVENIVSGVARDFLAHAIKNLERKNYPVVTHVHDEVASEVPKNFGSVEEFESILMDLPKWGKHYPIKASDGWRGERYRK